MRRCDGLLGLLVPIILGCASHGTSDAVTTVLRQGETRLADGDLLGARAAFIAATEREPKSFVAWIGLARACARGGAAAEAERALSRALAVSPETADALDLAGRTALELGKWVKLEHRKPLAALASTLLARAREKAPDLPHAAYHAGLAAWWSGDPTSGLAWFEEARKAGADPKVDEAVASLRAEVLRPLSRPTPRQEP